MAVRNPASIAVVQYENPRFEKAKPEHDADNPRRVYQVEKTVNTIAVYVGEWITPARVNELIDNSVTVAVTVPAKHK